MDDLAIGIDLGTTNSCVSVYLNGKTRILENSDGGKITPSFIFFTSLQEIIVGEHARRMGSGKPDHGIYDMLSMNVDTNGILTIKAKENDGKNVRELKINYTRGNQSEHEIKNFLLDAKKNKEEDERFEKFIIFKRYLLKYCVGVMYNLNKKDLANTHRSIYELCEETKAAGKLMEMEEENRVKELTKEIKLQCEPFVKYYNFKLMPVMEN